MTDSGAGELERLRARVAVLEAERRPRHRRPPTAPHRTAPHRADPGPDPGPGAASGVTRLA
ncbi:hypothetical protein [Streptomyces sp. NPDC096013]|uniref:hypothetical protein n=1 Tax=Streptomyces sp. NPDC096013 TaxID=3366069 RepID=UPI0037F3A058